MTDYNPVPRMIWFEDPYPDLEASSIFVDVGIIEGCQNIFNYVLPRTTPLKQLVERFHADARNPMTQLGIFTLWYNGVKIKDDDTMESLGIPNHGTVVASLTVTHPGIVPDSQVPNQYNVPFYL